MNHELVSTDAPTEAARSPIQKHDWVSGESTGEDAVGNSSCNHHPVVDDGEGVPPLFVSALDDQFVDVASVETQVVGDSEHQIEHVQDSDSEQRQEDESTVDSETLHGVRHREDSDTDK